MAKFRLSKRFKIFPGVSINLSKTGISGSLGIPGSGLSVHSKKYGIPANNTLSDTEPTLATDPSRKVGFMLGLGILIMPYVFAWVLLKDGYSKKAKVYGLGWLLWFFVVYGFMISL